MGPDLTRAAYFAYGSNMAAARLGARVGEIEPLGVYHLTGHDLRFHKAGDDGSAKCDAFHTGNPQDVVEGIVFELNAGQIEALDSIEGVGSGYEKKTVELLDPAGLSLVSFTYVATRIDAALSPFSWYKQHVLVGARSAGLSREYIARIEGVVSLEDLDSHRARREMGIHGASAEASQTTKTAARPCRPPNSR